MCDAAQQVLSRDVIVQVEAVEKPVLRDISLTHHLTAPPINRMPSD
jgi:hypothetical protein